MVQPEETKTLDGLGDGFSDVVVDEGQSPELTEGDSPYSEELAEPPWWKPDEPTVVHEPRIAEPFSSEDNQQDGQALLASLDAALNNPNIDLPRLPRIPEQVMLLTRGENTSMRQIAQLVSQDQVLSAGLLRQANSAMYGGIHKVSTLEGALPRLGMKGIRSAMIRESIKALTITVDGPKSTGKALWCESLAAAYVMAIYADYFKVSTEDAFMMGLLHDIGKVVVLRAYSDVSQNSGAGISSQTFEYLCQEYHEMMGEMLSQYWRLPEKIAAIIGNHHGPLDTASEHANLRAIIQLTDATLALIGYARPVAYDLLTTPAAIHLGVADNPDFCEFMEIIPETVELAITDS